MSTSRSRGYPFRAQFIEISIFPIEHCELTGKPLPPINRHIDICWTKLDAMANTPGRLGGDQRGTGAHERIVDRLAGVGVVHDRPAHALDRFLRAVHGLGVLVTVCDLPERRLLAVAGPVALT